METVPDYGEIEAVLQQILGKQAGFEQIVEKMIEGGERISVKNGMGIMGNILAEQIKGHGQTIGYLVLLIISAAVLSTIARAFRSRQISAMGFYMIYLLMFMIMMRSFGVCYALAEGVVTDLVDFMKVLMPAYLMAAAVSSYTASAAVYYEIFLMLIYYLQKLVAVVVLPAIRCYVLFTLAGNLGEVDFFSKGRKSLKKAILFLLKAMIGVTAGLQMIQGMITPAVDELKHTMLSKGVSSLGQMGNVAQNITDMMLGSGALLKNGIGAAAAVMIVTICLIPAVQVGCYVVFYHVLAAAAEPVSDVKITGAIEDVADGIGLLARLLLTVGVMFLLSIAITCITMGGMR